MQGFILPQYLKISKDLEITIASEVASTKIEIDLGVNWKIKVKINCFRCPKVFIFIQCFNYDFIFAFCIVKEIRF